MLIGRICRVPQDDDDEYKFEQQSTSDISLSKWSAADDSLCRTSMFWNLKSNMIQRAVVLETTLSRIFQSARITV
jgi:hypothetical protein